MKFFYAIACLLVCLSAQAMDNEYLELKAQIFNLMSDHPDLKSLCKKITDYDAVPHMIKEIRCVKGLATKCGGSAVLQELLKQGLNPHIKFDNGYVIQNLLRYALPTTYFLNDFQLKSLKMLLNLNVNPNERASFSESNNLLIDLILVIENMKKIRSEDQKIIFAIKSNKQKYIQALEMLLLHGADPYLKDEKSKLNVIELAASKCPELIDILIMGPKAFIDLRFAQLQSAAQKAGLKLFAAMKQEIGPKISALHYAEPQAYELALKKFKEKYSLPKKDTTNN